jgi:exopolysaccharide production protein ExoZ
MSDSAADREGHGSESSRTGAEGAALDVPTEFTSRRLVTIQCLRGIAALMIVFTHVLHQSPGFLAIWPTKAGQAGVDLFFVISGFVMVYVTADRERSAQQFILMRAARIIPVYWFYTLSAAALMFVLPQLFRSNELSVRHVVLSLLFVPHRTDAGGSFDPIIKQGWTLNYEVFFYVLFAVAMAISMRRRVILAAIVLAALAATGYWVRSAGISLGAPGFYLQDIILEFAIGMLIAVAFMNGRLQPLKPVLGGFLVVGGFIVLFAFDPLYSDATRILVYGLPAAAIVIGALAIERPTRVLKVPFLQFAGDSSYSVYLVHIFPVAVLRAIWPRLSLPMSGVPSFLLFLALSVALVMGLAAISYYTVERRSLRYLRKKISGASANRRG